MINFRRPAPALPFPLPPNVACVGLAQPRCKGLEAACYPHWTPELRDAKPDLFILTPALLADRPAWTHRLRPLLAPLVVVEPGEQIDPDVRETCWKQWGLVPRRLLLDADRRPLAVEVETLTGWFDCRDRTFSVTVPLRERQTAANWLDWLLHVDLLHNRKPIRR